MQIVQMKLFVPKVVMILNVVMTIYPLFRLWIHSILPVSEVVLGISWGKTECHYLHVLLLRYDSNTQKMAEHTEDFSGRMCELHLFSVHPHILLVGVITNDVQQITSNLVLCSEASGTFVICLITCFLVIALAHRPHWLTDPTGSQTPLLCVFTLIIGDLLQECMLNS